MYKKLFFLYFNKKPFQGVLRISHKNQKYEFGKPLDSKQEDMTNEADLQITDEAFYSKVILFGSIGFGEAYMYKYFRTKNLKKLLSWFIQNKNYLPGFGSKRPLDHFFGALMFIPRIGHALRKNTKEGSQKNIRYHYDLSNDFYKLWLDETMTYSSAIFNEAQSLVDAQRAKYRRLCEKIKLSAKDHLLEIGSGWGGLAIYAAQNYGCKITTVTISKQQFNFAKKRIKKLGLDKLVDIQLKDYRDIYGKYDKIVSIEMMEALGHEYVSKFISKCNSLLRAGGRIGLQVITYPDAQFKDYISRVDFMQKHIFPGGELLSVLEIAKSLKKTRQLELISLQNIGQSYAKTLEIWRHNFLANIREVKALGFDDVFIRKWLFYLTTCEVGFRKKLFDDAQIFIEKRV